MYIGLRVKYRLWDFSETLNFVDRFSGKRWNIKHLWKSVKLEPSGSTRTDVQTRNWVDSQIQTRVTWRQTALTSRLSCLPRRAHSVWRHHGGLRIAAISHSNTLIRCTAVFRVPWPAGHVCYHAVHMSRCEPSMSCSGHTGNETKNYGTPWASNSDPESSGSTGFVRSHFSCSD